MFNVEVDGILHGEHLRAALVNGQHVHGEGSLHAGELVQLVDDHLRAGIALQLDFDVVRQVAHTGDIRDNLITHQLSNTLLQHSAVHTVGHIGDVDELAAILIGHHLHLTAHAHAAAAGAEIAVDTLVTQHITTRGEVRALDVGTQSFAGDEGIVDVGADAVHHFAQVVRGHVGGHTHGNTRAAVHQQVRESGGEHHRFREAVVVVRLEIHRILVQVVHEGHTQVAQLGFGVSHGGGRVTFRRTEVTLPLHQHIAHVPGLSHGHQRAVGGLVTVRVVVTDGVTHDFTTLDCALAGHQSELVHGIQHAALGRLETVAGVRQGAGDNHRHGVIQEAAGYLLSHVDGTNSCFAHNQNEKSGVTRRGCGR